MGFQGRRGPGGRIETTLKARRPRYAISKEAFTIKVPLAVSPVANCGETELTLLQFQPRTLSARCFRA